MLIVAPMAVSTSVAAISESGIAVRLIRAVRQSNRNDDEDDDHQDAADDHRLREVVERPLDERRRGGRWWVDVDALEARLEVFEGLLDVAGHFQVLPVGCFSTISSRPGPSLITASPIGGGKPTLTSATSPSRSGAPLRKATVDLGQVLGRRRSASGGGRRSAGWACRRTRRAPTAEASVTALTTASSVTAVGAQPVGVDQHLVLPVALAPDRHVGHAGDRHQARAGSSTSPGRVSPSARASWTMTPILSTRLVDDSGEQDHRRLRRRRQPRRLDREPLLHHLPRRHQVGPLLEDQHHRRQPQHRLRADRLQPDRAVQRVLQRHADQALDLLGREPRRLGLDLDQRRRELGEDVQRRVPRRRGRPTIISTIDSASTSTRRRSEVETSQFIMMDSSRVLQPARLLSSSRLARG